jgi:hypothetical protein
MLASIMENRTLLQVSLVVLLFLASLWRGAAPERIVAGTFVGMWLLDRAYHLAAGKGLLFLSMDLGHLVIDLAAFGTMLAVSLQANRLYPIWLTALQLVAALSHIIRAMNPAELSGVYSIFIVAPSYLQIPSFMVGLLLHLRRRLKHGPYPSWQSSSNRLRDRARQR